ncbi:MAG: hypothetical protein BWY71_01746 [Planctomycetes bacterium ADurb.Bin412]|nr:MAG: hypothetical protein BWY71_01746 [Planctomycetes bacterium ADurb.Bin412]
MGLRIPVYILFLQMGYIRAELEQVAGNAVGGEPDRFFRMQGDIIRLIASHDTLDSGDFGIEIDLRKGNGVDNGNSAFAGVGDKGIPAVGGNFHVGRTFAHGQAGDQAGWIGAGYRLYIQIRINHTDSIFPGINHIDIIGRRQLEKNPVAKLPAQGGGRIDTRRNDHMIPTGADAHYITRQIRPVGYGNGHHRADGRAVIMGRHLNDEFNRR